MEVSDAMDGDRNELTKGCVGHIQELGLHATGGGETLEDFKSQSEHYANIYSPPISDTSDTQEGKR